MTENSPLVAPRFEVLQLSGADQLRWELCFYPVFQAALDYTLLQMVGPHQSDIAELMVIERSGVETMSIKVANAG